LLVVSLLLGWLVGWLACWLAGLLVVGWLAGWSVGWLVGWLLVGCWLAGLVGWLAGWLADQAEAPRPLEVNMSPLRHHAHWSGRRSLVAPQRSGRRIYTYIYIYIHTMCALRLICCRCRQLYALQLSSFCPLYHAQTFGVDVPLRYTVLTRLIGRPCGNLYICAWIADIPWCFQGCIVFLSDDVMALIGIH
jgi:hypothetical protein